MYVCVCVFFFLFFPSGFHLSCAMVQFATCLHSLLFDDSFVIYSLCDLFVIALSSAAYTRVGVFGDAFIYRIYFEGPSVVGDVPLLEIGVGADHGCDDGADINAGAQAWTGNWIEGGRTEHQRLTLSVDSGTVEGPFFQLKFTAGSQSTGGLSPIDGKQGGDIENNATSSTTACLPWGLEASELEAALQALPALSETNLTNTDRDIAVNTSELEVFGTSTLMLTSGYTDGVIFLGDSVRIAGAISGDGITRDMFTVIAVGGGSAGQGQVITLSTSVFVGVGKGGSYAAVTKHVAGSVRVRRDGFARGVVEVQQVHVTANATVPPTANDQAGLYRLAWRSPRWGVKRLQGEGDASLRQEHVTTCLPFDATAAQVQEALNALSVDFTDNGAVTFADADHINVTRHGDGTAASGYGYTYDLRFQGRPNYQGLSTALGDVEEVRVVSVGARGGCEDLRPQSESLLPGLTVNTNSSNGNPVLTNELSVDVRGLLRPGDRIRVEGSKDAHKVYTVAAINGRQDFTLKETFECVVSVGRSDVICGGGRSVYLVRDYGSPALWVETIVEGAAQWSYDIYFTGPTLGNVESLAVVEEGDGACREFDHWKAYGGMVRDAKITTVVEGGSAEVLQLDLHVKPTDAFNDYALSEDTSQLAERGPSDLGGGAFLLLMRYDESASDSHGSGSFAGARVVGPQDGEKGTTGSGGVGQCFPWNATASQLERAFDSVLPQLPSASGPQVHVSRVGRGDATSHWGFTHTLTFDGGAVRGDVAVAAAQHLQLDAVVFVPTVETLSATDGAGIRGGEGLITFAQKANTSPYPWSASALIEVEYLGAFMPTNGTHEPVEQIAWTVKEDAFSNHGAASSSVTYVANFTDFGEGVELLGYNMTVTLSTEVPSSLNPGDAWVLLIARCDDTQLLASEDGLGLEFDSEGALSPVPPVAQGVTISAVAEGHAAAKQLTLGSPFGGDMGGDVPLYLVNPTYAVRMPGTEVQRILLGDTFTPGGETQSWESESPTWSLTYGGETTRCLNWNAVKACVFGLVWSGLLSFTLTSFPLNQIFSLSPHSLISFSALDLHSFSGGPRSSERAERDRPAWHHRDPWP